MGMADDDNNEHRNTTIYSYSGDDNDDNSINIVSKSRHVMGVCRLEGLSQKITRRGVPSHQLSATRLLASPDNTRYPLDDSSDFYPFAEDLSGNGIPGVPNGGLPRFGARFMSSRRPTHPAVQLFDCFGTCRTRIDQFLAKRKIEQGVKLYACHKQQAAVKTWLSALKSIKQRGDKFQLLGYLYQAYMDFGKYRESLEFAHRQLGISEELDSPSLRAEAYLNLARAHQTLGGLERALSYARQSLYNDCEGCSTMGYVHLTVGTVSMELGAFNKAIDSFQKAHKIGQNAQDNALLLQVYVGLSEVFGRLLDSERGAAHAARAYDLSRSLQPGDLNTRHHRAALLQMAASLRRQGDLGDAHDYCTEAMRLATVAGDQGCYARAVRIIGDVYRRKCDIGKALRQYEIAMGAGQTMGDRLAQMEAMDGAARCLEALRLQQKICNCRPLEFNTRLLEVATSVGAVLLVKTVRKRLAGIYKSLGDDEACEQQERSAETTAHYPACPHCSQPIGLTPTALEALPCSHLVHARCVTDMMKRRNCSSLSRGCAACQSPSRALYTSTSSTNPGLPPPVPPHSHEQLLLSLPQSLRTSNITINSDTSSHQITSSV